MKYHGLLKIWMVPSLVWINLQSCEYCYNILSDSLKKKIIKKKISLYYACFKGPVQHDVIFSIAEMIFLPYRFVCYKIFLSINRTFRLQVKLIWNIHSNFKCCTIYRNILERMRVSYNIGSDKCIIKYYRGIVTGIVFNKVMQHPIEKVSVQKRYNLHMRVYK